MPEIDVSNDVLLDPFVAATRFMVVRRRSWTDINGIAQKSESRIAALGSVISPGNELDRQSDYQSQPAVISVITKFFLRVAALDNDGVNWQPDLVVWQGNFYLVTKLDDYSQFNSGFVSAECTLFEYIPTPTSGNPPSVYVGKVDFRQRNNSGLAGALL